MNNIRLEIASRIIAGWAANPAIYAANSNCGWALVNCREQELVRAAIWLADILIEEELKPKSDV